MATQKIEQSFSYSLRELDPASTPTNREIGVLMDEYCQGAASRCTKTGRCVIGAMSTVHRDAINVKLGCEAQGAGDSLVNCAVTQRSASSIDESLNDLLLESLE